MHKTITHNSCRLCGSDQIEEAFSLGDQFINDFVEKDKIKSGIKAPLDLVMCKQCSLIQLRHTAPQELLYSRNYWYRSGVTQTMRDGLRDVSLTVERMVNLQSDDVVLDIGANDGTLLGSFKNPNLIKVGCEPANNLIEMLSKHTKYVMHDFWSSERYNQLAKEWEIGKAKIITALGMFYDLDDPNTFINDIQKTLAKDGIFVAQLMCLASMLQKNDLGNICHEHIEYYSYDSLKYMFEKNGLEIFKIEENAINGGSYRIFARHLSKGSIDFDESCSMNELIQFKKRIDDNRDKCVNFIKEEVKKGKTVYVYGASTKGNVILQYYGLDSGLITAAAERSPEKWGKYTIGSGIPIISEDEARAAQPDYFLVLPWAFFDEFYQRESDWLSKGGKFIVPLPDFRIVS
jgi:2-polyprenyl-3-methyl-5-hydroxy-6-metoxy-1,4-benzoquinol methylase